MYTRLRDGLQSVMWDGSYALYRKLLDDPTFVGILHNPDNKKEILKVWNENKAEWQDCEPGQYVIRYTDGTFFVGDRDLVGRLRAPPYQQRHPQYSTAQ